MNHLNPISYFILVVIVFLPFQSFGQRMDIENYLSTAWIEALCFQDDAIWIGTVYGGAYKKSLSGNHLEYYSSYSGLATNDVLDILVDQNNNVWFSHNGYSPKLISILKDNSWEYVTSSDGIGEHKIRCMNMDSNGIIWVASEGSGVSKFENETWTNYNESDGLLNNQSYQIQINSKNEVWISHENGLSFYNGNNWSSIPFKENVSIIDIELVNDSPWIVADSIYLVKNSEYIDSLPTPNVEIYEIKVNSDNLYLGTIFGVYQYLDNKWVVISREFENWIHESKSILFSENNEMWVSFGSQIHHFSNEWKEYYLLNNATVREIDIDKNNKKWLATSFGLYSFNEDIWEYLYYPKDSLLGNNLTCVKSDDIGNIWIGNTQGVHKFDGIKWENFLLEKDTEINDIEFDSNNNPWIGTNKGLYTIQNSTIIEYNYSIGLINNFVTDIEFDEKDTLWIGTKAGLSKFYNEIWTNYDMNFVMSNEIYSVELNSDGSIWIGTNFGIVRLINETFENIELDPPGSNSYIRIRDIEFDSYGDVWIADDGGTVYRSNVSGSVLVKFNEDNGLTNFGTYDIEIDNEQTLWLGTGRGISTMKRNIINSISSPTNISQPQITLYPNPSSNFLIIGSELFENKDVNYSIVSITGQTIVSQRLLIPTDKLEIKISSLPIGTYLLTISITDQNVLKTIKFQKN